MNAENAFRISSVRANFLTEATGESGVLNGQALLIYPFIPREQFVIYGTYLKVHFKEQTNSITQ